MGKECNKFVVKNTRQIFLSLRTAGLARQISSLQFKDTTFFRLIFIPLHRGPDFDFSSKLNFCAKQTCAKLGGTGGFVRADTTLDERLYQVKPQFSTEKYLQVQTCHDFAPNQRVSLQKPNTD